MPSPSRRSRAAGFTLVELVVTLLLTAILAVVVIPRLTNMDALRQRAEYDKVFSAIEYARKAAIAKRRYACVSLSASQVSLTVDANPPEATATPFGGTCPFATALVLPSPDSSCAGSNQTCLKTTSISSTSNAFQFDARGRASATVVVTVSGYPSFTVEAETGYVH